MHIMIKAPEGFCVNVKKKNNRRDENDWKTSNSKLPIQKMSACLHA